MGKLRLATIASAVVLGWIASNSAQADYSTCLGQCFDNEYQRCNTNNGGIYGETPILWQQCIDKIQNKCQRRCENLLAPPPPQRGGSSSSSRHKQPQVLPPDWWDPFHENQR